MLKSYLHYIRTVIKQVYNYLQLSIINSYYLHREFSQSITIAPTLTYFENVHMTEN